MRLLSFSVENYKSFCDKQTVKFAENEQNVTAFFGPNSAGKSNLFAAIEFYCDFILHSTDFRRQKILEEDYFKYLDRKAGEPTSFSAEFRNRKNQFKYSFAIKRDGEVGLEKLERKSGDSYDTVFSRGSIINGRYDVTGFTSTLLHETRADALVLTRAFAANNKIAKEVFNCIEGIVPLSAIKSVGMTAEEVMNNPEMKEKVLRFLRMSDLYIQDFQVEQMKDTLKLAESSMLTKEAQDLMRRMTYKITTVHMSYDDNGVAIGTRLMSMDGDESRGTRQMFEYASSIIGALNGGKVLYIDELEMGLHPRECAFIVGLFSAESGENFGNGQLIINTHEERLMDLLGKENIYLLGKNKIEATVVERLSGVRSDDKNLSKKYYSGLFGATPRVGV